MKDIIKKVENGNRITPQEALKLYDLEL